MYQVAQPDTYSLASITHDTARRYIAPTSALALTSGLISPAFPHDTHDHISSRLDSS